MPLFDDRLTIWDIAFRWAGADPERVWIRIPLRVKDNFRLIVEAISDGDLYCSSLNTSARPLHPEDSISRYRDIVDACISGDRYDRQFLKRHSVRRWEFAQWCEKAGIAFPEFWFPPGWKTDDPLYPASLHRAESTGAVPSADKKLSVAAGEAKPARRNDQIWADVFAAAKVIWAESRSMPSAQVARRIRAMKELGAARFTEEVIRKRIAKHAPDGIRGKPGRPRTRKSS